MTGRRMDGVEGVLVDELLEPLVDGVEGVRPGSCEDDELVRVFVVVGLAVVVLLFESAGGAFTLGAERTA